MASRGVFHFDEFALDVGERRLLRGSETVRLSPKAYDVLVVLVRQPGRLVTKDELLAHVWPESFVEEGILNVHVAALRKALGAPCVVFPPAHDAIRSVGRRLLSKMIAYASINSVYGSMADHTGVEKGPAWSS